MGIQRDSHDDSALAGRGRAHRVARGGAPSHPKQAPLFLFLRGRDDKKKKRRGTTAKERGRGVSGKRQRRWRRKGRAGCSHGQTRGAAGAGTSSGVAGSGPPCAGETASGPSICATLLLATTSKAFLRKRSAQFSKCSAASCFPDVMANKRRSSGRGPAFGKDYRRGGHSGTRKRNGHGGARAGVLQSTHLACGRAHRGSSAWS